MARPGGSIGIVGCGLLGSAVARTLAAQGRAVSAWNRTAQKASVLAADGVTACASLDELIATSKLILITLSSYDAVHEVLGAAGSLERRTVAVLTTGVPDDATRLAELIELRGGRALDAALLGYPADLGREATMLAVAGPGELWEAHASVFRALGGASRHVSEDVAGANTLDVAATGAFYTVAYGAAVEAATYARARGLDPRALVPAAEAWLAILRRNLHEVADAVGSGEHGSDQATLDTYLDAARAWRGELADAGLRGALMAAVERNLEAAGAQGLGRLGFSAQSLAMTREPTGAT